MNIYSRPFNLIRISGKKYCTYTLFPELLLFFFCMFMAAATLPYRRKICCRSAAMSNLPPPIGRGGTLDTENYWACLSSSIIESSTSVPSTSPTQQGQRGWRSGGRRGVSRDTVYCTPTSICTVG